MGFWKSLGKVAKAAVPVVIGVAMPQAIVNTGIAGVVKHTPFVDNSSIPVVNLLASTAVAYLPRAIESGDWVTPIMPALQEGGLLAAGSTAIHQTLKIPLAEIITGTLAQRVGPGDKFSI